MAVPATSSSTSACDEFGVRYNPKPLSSYLKRQIQATKQGLPNRGGFVQYEL